MMRRMDSSPGPRLPIQVTTEDGRVHHGPTGADLGLLLARIGRDGDRYAVVEHDPVESLVFVQAWRGDDGVYLVEYSQGGPEQHFSARLADPNRLTDLVTSWANRGESWLREVDWTLMDLTSTRLDEQTRGEAEDFARSLIHCGFTDLIDTANAVHEHFDPDEQPVGPEEAALIVGRLWSERLQEQQSWPEVTDPDRLEHAFEALDADGITARMNFTCCGRCGFTEIGAEAEEGARGFVFFHSQAAEGVVRSGTLWLSFGTFPGSADTAATIGAEVIAALQAAGLPTQWSGAPGDAIGIRPMDWRKRLPE